MGEGWATVNTTLWSGVLYTRQEISSMSKLDALKAAVTNFVNSVSANAKEFNVDHQIALVGFASNEGTESRTRVA